jgi:hypothetical protein
MNSKEKSLPFRRLGMTRRGLRRNRGRRETCLPLSEIVLGDSHREPRKVEGSEQMPRLPPMDCWGYKGNHRYRDCLHRKYKVRTVHTVQQAEIVEDMGSRMPRIYAALDNKQEEFQSHMIELEGTINN